MQNVTSTRVALLAIAAMAAPAPAQCEPQRLLSPDGIRGESYGLTVAMNDHTIVVGDPQAATSCSTGGAYAYALEDGAWVRQQTIAPFDVRCGDRFGFHVAMDGDRLIAGAIFADLVGGMSSGGAYIFDFDGDQWVETGRLVPPEPMGLSGFGARVAIDGDLALVEQNETLYVFERGTEEWEWRGTVQAPDAIGERQGFGIAMQITPEWLFVGASEDRTLEPNAGAVYVYRRDGSEFTFLHKIEPAAPIIRSRLGYSLAFDGESLFVGGPVATDVYDAQGIVYRYNFDGEQWVLVQEITSDPVVDDANFGRAVAVLDGTLVVGADDETVGLGEGAAYAFRQRPDGTWGQIARIVPPSDSYSPPSTSYLFGFAVATNGRWATVGAPFERIEGENPGAAYAFDLSCLLCRPDLDADGTLTIFDFLLFFNLFQDGDPIADFDGDGELTIFDFLAFQTAFDAGCG